MNSGRISCLFTYLIKQYTLHIQQQLIRDNMLAERNIYATNIRGTDCR